MDEVKIQVIFTADTIYGTYRDALYFTEDEWALDPDIESLKQARVDNWIDAIENAPAPNQPTKAQLQSEVALLTSKINELNAKIVGM